MSMLPASFRLGMVSPLIPVLLLTFALFTTSPLRSQESSARPSPHIEYSSQHRNSERALPQTIATANAKLREKLAAATAISVVTADFDSDGTSDLITGYSTGSGGVLMLQRGSPTAHAPGPRETAMLAAGQFVAPYVDKAEPMEIPESPDLLQAADLNGHGAFDIVTAAIGSSTAYVLTGDGHGGFSTPQPLALSGAIRTMTVWRTPYLSNLLVASVCGGAGCGLQLLRGDGTTAAFIPTAAAVTGIDASFFNGSQAMDLAVSAGGAVSILDGDSILGGQPRFDSVPVTGAVAVAGGRFTYDRRGLTQLAVLDLDGTLHILARTGLDTSDIPASEVLAKRNGTFQYPAPVKLAGAPWSEFETLNDIGSGDAPLMLHGHMTGSGMDDIAVMADGKYVVVSHSMIVDSGQRRSTPNVVVDSTSAVVSHAVLARVSATGRAGVVSAARTAHPNISVPSTYHTLTVNTATDAAPTSTTMGSCYTGSPANQCNIRSAVAEANADYSTLGVTKVDVIDIPAGTYSFTTSYQPPNDSGGSINWKYNLDASMDLVGTGGCLQTNNITTSCATIINGNSLDKLFSADSGVTHSGPFNFAAYDIFFSNMEFENAINNNSTSCSGGECDYYGGAMDWESWGTGNLTIQNVVFNNNNSKYYQGGAVFASDSNHGTTNGVLEIDNSTVSSNTATTSAGAIVAGAYNPIIFGTDAFKSNSGTASGFVGGAVELITNAGDAQVSAITGTSFTSNSAGSSTGKGGALYADVPLTITGSTFSGNSAGVDGGALFLYNNGTGSVSIAGSTFTANSTTATTSYGGAIAIDPEAANWTTTLTYNRFHGNTVGGSGALTGVAVLNDGQTHAIIAATDNWWGCNGAATGTGCDTGGLQSGLSGPTFTATPYTRLTLALSSSSIIEGNSITATASLGQDSSGTVYTAANDTADLAAPITTFALTDTGTGTYTPSSTAFSSTAATGTSFAAATESATTNANGTGVATVTVDGQTVTANYTVTAPPTISEAFAPTSIAPNGTSTVTFTLGNPTGNPTFTGVAFSDTLPSGLTVASPNGLTNACGGTVTATAGGGSISLSGASIATGATCTVAFNVTSTSTGTYTNTTSAVTSSNGGTGSSASATLTVAYPAPVANSQSVTVTFNTAKAITLTATGSGTLAYSVIAQPTHGALSGTAPNLTYTPTTGYAGSDSFTFQANNGTASNTATVSITVNPGPPAAFTVQLQSPFKYPDDTEQVRVTVVDSGGN